MSDLDIYSSTQQIIVDPFTQSTSVILAGPQGPAGPAGAPSAPSNGDKGDITVTNSGLTWTIDTNAITTAKVADGAITAAKVAADVATQVELDAVGSIALSKADPVGIYIGSTGQGPYAPDSAATNIAGSITLIGHILIINDGVSIPTSGSYCIGSKWSTGTRKQYILALNFSAGGARIALFYSYDGFTTGQAQSTVVIPRTKDIRVAATFDPSAGVARFFTSLDGFAWTKLGADVSVTPGSLYVGGANGVGELAVGGSYSHTVNSWNGLLGAFSIADGIGTSGVPGGTVVASWTPHPMASKYLDPYGNTWSIRGTSWQWRSRFGEAIGRQIVVAADLDETIIENTKAFTSYTTKRFLWFPESPPAPNTNANRVYVTDNSALDVTGDITIIIEGHWNPSPSPTVGTLLTKGNTRADPSTMAYYITIEGINGIPQFGWGEGSTLRGHNFNLWSDRYRFHAFTLDVNNGSGGYTARLWQSHDGITWSLIQSFTGTGGLSDGATAINNTTVNFTIGSGVLGLNPAAGLTLFSMSISAGIGVSGAPGGTVVWKFDGDTDLAAVSPEASVIPVSVGPALNVIRNSIPFTQIVKRRFAVDAYNNQTAIERLAAELSLATKHLDNFAIGVGSPQGVHAARPGVVYTDSSTSPATVWVKGSGTNSSGWHQVYPLEFNPLGVHESATLAGARVDGVAYVAHRAGPMLHPEESYSAYSAILAQGAKILEIDVQTLSDGTLAVMHDSTLDRTTNSTGNVSAQTAATWKKLQLDTAPAGSAWVGNLEPPPLFDDLIREYGNRVALAIESKSSGAMQKIVDVLKRNGVDPSTVCLASFNFAELSPAISYGAHTQALNGASQTPATLQAAGVDSVALAAYDGVLSQGTIDSYLERDIEVWVYTIDRHAWRDGLISQGVTGFYSDDPIYLSGLHPKRTTDPFDTRYWWHGMLPTTVSGNGRGQLISGGYLRPSDVPLGVMMGWANPVSTPNDLEIDFKITFRESSEDGHWAGIDVMTNDLGAGSSVFAAGNDGYRFLARKVGTYSVYRVSGSSVTLLGTATGTPISNNVEASFKIVITATHVNFERTDVVEGEQSFSDATYRGSYLGVISNSIYSDVSDITLS